MRVIGGGDDAASIAICALAPRRLDDAPVVVPACVRNRGRRQSGARGGGRARAGRSAVHDCCRRASCGSSVRCAARTPGPSGCRIGAHPPACTLALGGTGEPDRRTLPTSSIVRADPADPPPPRCAVVLTVRSPARRTLDVGGEVREIAVEALGGRAGAQSSPQELAARGRAAAGRRRLVWRRSRSAPLLGSAHRGRRAALCPRSSASRRASRVVIDLVADGPHAVVAGRHRIGQVRAAGHLDPGAVRRPTRRARSASCSPTSRAAPRSTRSAEVPHVTGVITDLDGTGARRAIESLRAEVRWREAELARVGARDILRSAGRPSAARDRRRRVRRAAGRASRAARGVHRCRGARSRARACTSCSARSGRAGVVRESLLANCPLRISLRVTDAADSRAVIGTDEAAALPGGADARGIALVRSASDHVARGACASPCRRSPTAKRSRRRRRDPRPRRPWLPELPHRIDLDRSRGRWPRDAGDTLLLGLVDEPDRQRQRPVGAARAAPRAARHRVGRQRQVDRAAHARRAGRAAGRAGAGGGRGAAWDAVAELSRTHATARDAARRSTTSTRSARALPPEYARELVERLERLVRGAGDAEILVVASAQRLGGAVARIADLLPRRARAGDGVPRRAHRGRAAIPRTTRRAARPAAAGSTAGRCRSRRPRRRRLAAPPSRLAPWHPRGAADRLRDAALARSRARRSRRGSAAGAATCSRSTSSRATANGRRRAASSWPATPRSGSDTGGRSSTMRSDHDLVVDAVVCGRVPRC